MKKSEFYKLMDSYVLESQVLDNKIRQIIKEELLLMITGKSASNVASPQLTETKRVQPIKSTTNEHRTRPVLDIKFDKIGHQTTQMHDLTPQQLEVPGTNGLIHIDSTDLDEFDQEMAPSILDQIDKGMSTGNKFLDQVFTHDYSNIVKRHAKK